MDINATTQELFENMRNNLKVDLGSVLNTRKNVMFTPTELGFVVIYVLPWLFIANVHHVFQILDFVC